jgi:hypothetical protein
MFRCSATRGGLLTAVAMTLVVAPVAAVALQGSDLAAAGHSSSPTSTGSVGAAWSDGPTGVPEFRFRGGAGTDLRLRMPSGSELRFRGGTY